MKKPTVLWIGTNRSRCTVLAELYRDVIDSVHADTSDGDVLRERTLRADAMILVLDCDERADTPPCRAVYTYSAKQRVPVYLMGQPHHLRAALMISPNAVLYPIADEEIAEVFSEGVPRRSPLPPVAVAFLEHPLYFTFLEENLDPGLTSWLRLIYAEPNPNYIDRMARKEIEPKLFLFDKAVLGGACDFFTDRLFEKGSFRQVPYLILGDSDKFPDTAAGDREPLLKLNIRKECGSRLSDAIREVLGIK
ncbi:MAG: hypothetical protein NC084_02670 [Bacteroides sp.]|nr:hypothetical protein [Eubacterium sp.]MCM1417419.1 hypothetical protein [Roseburia sp.]MCM1461598.1 hypothetical protein [Bacteroides sp.]